MMLKIFYLKVSEIDFSLILNEQTEKLVEKETYISALEFRNIKSRFTRLAGEQVIRYLLSRYFYLSKGDFLIVRREHGKPFLEGVDNIFYNISHSGDYLVCALSDSEVGVDIEKRAVARMEVARRFFHPNEIIQLECLGKSEQNQLFFDYWSVKECFLKYTGSGLTRSLSSFCVGSLENPVHIYTEEASLPVYIRKCPVDAGYSCFVCSGSDIVPEIMPLTIEELLR